MGMPAPKPARRARRLAKLTRKRRADVRALMIGKVTVTVPAETPIDDVVDVVSRLIRFDTTNTGELETTKGEAERAHGVAAQLKDVGYQVEYLESGAPGRGNVFARLKGTDSSRGALLIHGHLDVVPAEPAEWRSVHVPLWKVNCRRPHVDELNRARKGPVFFWERMTDDGRRKACRLSHRDFSSNPSSVVRPPSSDFP